ncbi:MAG: molecular chaperone DnaJ [Patescibacteria group bacterium]|nr:molecular chaperone DnaJ [Patescibacteria group bacterium]
MGKDYYNILGVSKTASQEEIKKVFRQKAHQYHPDKQGGDEAKFKEINEAYQVLGDEKKRAQYDQFGSAFEHGQAGGGFSGFDGFRDFSGFANGFNVNFEDLGDVFGGLGDIFGFSARGGQGRRGGTRARRGNDIEVTLTIDFFEAVFGAEKEISLQKTVKCDKCGGNGAEPGAKIETCKSCKGSGRQIRMQRTIFGQVQTQVSCPDCNGEGKTFSEKCKKCGGRGIVREMTNLKVKIPAGIDEGESIRLSGQGEAGAKGASAGDLYLKIRVKPDKRFERDGYDIKSTSEIKFSQAALGDKIEVATVDGPVKLKIPEGTQSDTVFRLRDRGIIKLQGRGRGDHLVKVIVKTPTGLSRKQRKALEELGV